jgi:Predicted metal-dependent hydrolase
VIEATKLIRSGHIHEMGRVAEQHMPLFGERGFLLRTVGSPTGGPLGDNKVVWNDEFLATEIGQVGSCMDGLGHIGCQLGDNGDLAEMRFYNGLTLADVAGPYGLKKLGVEKVKPFFTRGVLLDIAGLRGRMLAMGEEITLTDVRTAIAVQGLTEASIEPGDAIFFNTGWGSLWSADAARYNDGEPGIGMDVARWIIDKEVCLTGCDNWGCEVVPNPIARLAFPVHQELIAKHGIFIFEGLTFDSLLADRAWRFAFILTPLLIKGATGSIARPIAIT